MQDFATGGYTEPATRAALASLQGGRRPRFRYELLNGRASLGNLDTVTDAKISYDIAAAIKGACSFSMSGAEADKYNLAGFRFKPWWGIVMPDGGLAEWPQGVYVMSTQPATLDTSVTVAVQGYDLLQVLDDDKLDDRYTVAAGELYTEVVKFLLTSTNASIDTLSASTILSPLALPESKEWEAGTTKLAVISDLLAAINYQTPHFNANGEFEMRPYIDPATASPAYSYAVGATSVITGKPTRTLDLFAVPNKFVQVKSNPDAAPLVGTYINTDPASPTSTVSRGRTIVSVEPEADAADQASIDGLAARAGANAAQAYQSVTFEAGVIPTHQHADVLELVIPELGISGNYEEQAWSYEFKIGATASRTVQKAVAL